MRDVDRLLEAWRDGTLAPDEADLLGGLLRADPALRRRLVAAAWLDADLVRHFHARERRAPLRWRPLLWAMPLAAAAALLIAGWLVLRAPAAPELLDGRVAGDLAVDRELVIEQSATLRLQDGTRVAAAAGARLVVRRPEAGRRQTVELAQGEVRCAVVAAPERFRVATRAGEVVAVGTDFTVRARQGGMEVVVHHGRVRVAHEGTTVELAAGARRAFGEVRVLVVQGRAAGFADGVLTLRSGDSGKSVRIPLAPGCSVLLDGEPSTAAALPAEAQVEVAMDGQGRGERVEAAGPRLRGTLARLDAAARTLTLAARGEAPERTLPLLPHVRVLRDGTPLTLADLAPGDPVRVVLAVDGTAVVEIDLEPARDRR